MRKHMEAVQKTNVTRKKGICGSSLKLIAITAMLIDHIGAALLGRYLWKYQYVEMIWSQDAQYMTSWMAEYGWLYYTYQIMRIIGRIGFPIFCFLLIEGFQKTRDVKKYALRLGAFALISEVPFDLAFKAQILEFSYQNVFFTLFLGLLTVIACDAIERTEWNKVAKGITVIGAIAAGAMVAELLRTDYGAIGVLCIMALYLFRRNKVWQLVAGCVAFCWELPALLAFLPIGFYSGERGLRLKYIFYLFYPLHLLIIYGVSVLLGMNGYMAL